MRILRIAAVLFFIASLAVSIGVSVIDASRTDSTVPVIENTIDVLEISVESGEEELFRGLTAYDEKDGDLTEKIMIARTSRLAEDNSCQIKYVVFDSNNNSAVLTRTVRYTDYESPRFSLSQPLVYSIGENIRFLDRVTASDVLVGDISGKIKVTSSSVSNYQAGTYPVEMEVSNDYGDTVSLQLNVIVTENADSGPEIQLSEYLVYLQTGESFSPRSYIRSVLDTDGSTLSVSSVSISGSVDTETAGCYQLTYTAESGDGETGRTYLTVVVTD